MAQVRASTVQQEKRGDSCSFAVCREFPLSCCLVEEWQDCEELGPMPTEKWT